MAGQVFVLFVTFVPGSCGFLPKKVLKKETRDKAAAEKAAPPQDAVDDEPPPKKPRMIWLDNLKSWVLCPPPLSLPLPPPLSLPPHRRQHSTAVDAADDGRLRLTACPPPPPPPHSAF